MFRFKFVDNMDELIDGRSIKYLAKELGIDRESVSLILRGKELCSYAKAKRFVDRCKPHAKVKDFFDEIPESEVCLWKKK